MVKIKEFKEFFFAPKRCIFTFPILYKVNRSIKDITDRLIDYKMFFLAALVLNLRATLL